MKEAFLISGLGFFFFSFLNIPALLKRFGGNDKQKLLSYVGYKLPQHSGLVLSKVLDNEHDSQVSVDVIFLCKCTNVCVCGYDIVFYVHVYILMCVYMSTMVCACSVHCCAHVHMDIAWSCTFVICTLCASSDFTMYLV